jgi:hypothetical protein
MVFHQNLWLRRDPSSLTLRMRRYRNLPNPVDGFGSYFALLLIEHNEEVTQAIISKIDSVFYTENDKS